eukprot:TRINITY_DN3755_c0_g1_i2.p1 TRINITY_DN3755_c0_g1~~TRINITY_DN3755_c0_g1_i2.p1  ORF type:complete len:247 (-),score=117.61 TRINITY_DN3755_c0_g1_i2:62-802(-)
MSRYDRAISIFSPDGRIFQVEYAQEAVRKGTTAVGIRGDDCIVLAVEKKSIAKLQEPRTVHKIVAVDDHVFLAFAGLTADGRVLIDRTRVECQSYRLSLEDAPSVEHVARSIAGVQQKYTQSGGMRPFGVSMLVVGYEIDGQPRLFQTDPSGTHVEWKANAIGRNSKTVREFLEEHYEAQRGNAAQLAVASLLEVVESTRSIEIAIVKPNEPIRFLTDDQVAEIIATVEKEREEEAEANKKARNEK